MSLEILAKELEACNACPFRQEAIAPVGWFGDPKSPIVFVGEGPGGVEDDYGCPLIGPSGQLLDKALWAAKMTRDRVLTTNVIKCRPKNNRTPDIAEARPGAGNHPAQGRRSLGRSGHALSGQCGHAHHQGQRPVVPHGAGL